MVQYFDFFEYEFKLPAFLLDGVAKWKFLFIQLPKKIVSLKILFTTVFKRICRKATIFEKSVYGVFWRR
jgi:hypothetical protein